MDATPSIYQQLKFHQIMVGRLKIWLLDCLIGMFLALLGMLVARHHPNLTIFLGIVAGLMASASLVVGYGIYRGQQKFNNILNNQRKS
ncbi:MAG: hypothetical protein PHI41_03485 [Erysipelotrichaceae bacterium]|nr:hypothetical protein [Erysipelotrichaceae bacterium]MDD3809689.1 hypothetical protein [Erysipelotrichaceae bacterium]